jgi:hypothetical protein
MGQLSAEARGQVRIAIENVYKKYPEPLRDEVKNHIDKLCLRTFSKKKRLSINDMAYFYCIELVRDIPIFNIENPDNPYYLYAEPSVKHLLYDAKNFDDIVLELREISIHLSKRKIRFFDLPINIHISSHFIGRYFERGQSSEYLINEIITGLYKSMHYVHAIKLQDGLIDVAFPFLDGLAFGEMIDESNVSDREMKKEWDIHGVMNYEAGVNIGGPSDSVLRLKTFMNDGMLNLKQDKILNRMKSLFSDQILKDSLEIMIKPKFMNIEISPDIIYTKNTLNELFQSDDWINVFY